MNCPKLAVAFQSSKLKMILNLPFLLLLLFLL